VSAASPCVLVGSIFVSAVRHWWTLSIASFWVFMLVGEEINGFRQEPFSTLDLQIAYLSEEEGRSPAAKAASAS
jgi:hypothetical protein